MVVIQQYLLAALAGGAATAALAFAAHRLHGAKAARSWRAATQAQIEALTDEHARQSERAGQVERDKRELEALLDQLREQLTAQSRVVDKTRAALDASGENKDQLAQVARQIAWEAARLKGLAGTFERWHEQMTSLMSQN